MSISYYLLVCEDGGSVEVACVDKACYGHRVVCTFGWVYLMCTNAPRTCWALTSGYNVSVLQGAMGFWVLGASGVTAAQRVPVAHLTGV